jgi:hypothetical protein
MTHSSLGKQTSMELISKKEQTSMKLISKEKHPFTKLSSTAKHTSQDTSTVKQNPFMNYLGEKRKLSLT